MKDAKGHGSDAHQSGVEKIGKPYPKCDDCTITALANVTGRTNEQVWEHAQDHFGRAVDSNRTIRGMTDPHTIWTLKSMGHDAQPRYDMLFKVTGKDGRVSLKQRTLGDVVKQITRSEPEKTFLVSTRNHMMSIKNGLLKDEAGTHYGSRVRSIYEVKS